MSQAVKLIINNFFIGLKLSSRFSFKVAFLICRFPSSYISRSQVLCNLMMLILPRSLLDLLWFSEILFHKRIIYSFLIIWLWQFLTRLSIKALQSIERWWSFVFQVLFFNFYNHFIDLREIWRKVRLLLIISWIAF